MVGAAPKDRSRLRTLGLIAVIVGIGLLAISIFASEEDSPWAVLGSALMISSAAIAAGALLGFLFGIPRTLSEGIPPTGTSEATGTTLARIRANTNLEQISDWLTKIIVGVTLVQLGTVRAGAVRLFDALAPALGGGDGASAFAGALVIYFSVSGFLMSWLLTRLLLGRLMAKSDQAAILLTEAAQEEDPEKAEAKRAQALVLQTSPLTTSVQSLIASLPPGGETTGQSESSPVNEKGT